MQQYISIQFSYSVAVVVQLELFILILIFFAFHLIIAVDIMFYPSSPGLPSLLSPAPLKASRNSVDRLARRQT